VSFLAFIESTTGSSSICEAFMLFYLDVWDYSVGTVVLWQQAIYYATAFP